MDEDDEEDLFGGSSFDDDSVGSSCSTGAHKHKAPVAEEKKLHETILQDVILDPELSDKIDDMHLEELHRLGMSNKRHKPKTKKAQEKQDAAVEAMMDTITEPKVVRATVREKGRDEQRRMDDMRRRMRQKKTIMTLRRAAEPRSRRFNIGLAHESCTSDQFKSPPPTYHSFKRPEVSLTVSKLMGTMKGEALRVLQMNHSVWEQAKANTTTNLKGETASKDGGIFDFFQTTEDGTKRRIERFYRNFFHEKVVNAQEMVTTPVFESLEELIAADPTPERKKSGRRKGISRSQLRQMQIKDKCKKCGGKAYESSGFLVCHTCGASERGDCKTSFKDLPTNTRGTAPYQRVAHVSYKLGLGKRRWRRGVSRLVREDHRLPTLGHVEGAGLHVRVTG